MAILTEHGYTVVARNIRTRYGEIDVVAYDNQVLVIVEVRSRRGASVGEAAASVGATKQRRLAVLAEGYVQSLARRPEVWRIDVLALRVARDGSIEEYDLIRSAVGG